MPSRAKFSTKTKKAILERDRYCIFCWWEAIDAHHVYFWTDSNYWDNRNDIDQWDLYVIKTI